MTHKVAERSSTKVETSSPSVVGVSFAVEMLEFDEVAATFKISGYVSFETKADGVEDCESMSLEDAKRLVPFPPTDRLFTNALSTEESDSSFRVKDSVFSGRIGYTGNVGTILGYRFFPFDRQILSIVLQNENRERFPLVEFKPLKDKPSWFGLLARIPDKWKSYPPTLGYQVTEGVNYCAFHMPIERKSNFYVVNVVFPLMVVAGLGLTTFAIDINDLASRLSVVLTLLLAAIAFKYVTNEYIPVISYVTALDAYIMLSYSQFFAAAVESSIVAQIYPCHDEARSCNAHDEALTRRARLMDTITLLVYGTSWLSVSLLFLLSGTFGLLTESWETVNKRRLSSEVLQLNSYQYAKDGEVFHFEDINTEN